MTVSLVPQVDALTNLARDQRGLIKKLANGPVFLTLRSKPAAVMVAPAQWDETIRELLQLRRIIAADKQFAEIDRGEYEEFATGEALEKALA